MSFGKPRNIKMGWINDMKNIIGRKLEKLFKPQVINGLKDNFKETENVVYKFYELCKYF